MRLYPFIDVSVGSLSVAAAGSADINAVKQQGPLTMIVTPAATTTCDVYAVIGGVELLLSSTTAAAVFTFNSNVEAYRIKSTGGITQVDYKITEYAEH